MATKTFKIGLSNTDKQNMAQDVYERILALTFPEYDSAEEYNVGDFVVYNDQLYKCIGATTGAWDSTKWQLATLNDLVTDIEGAVAFVNDKANVDGNYPTMTVGAAENLTPYSEESGTDQEEPFNFQATATANGSNPLFSASGLALLKEKRGNTIVVNQQVKNNDFSDGTTYWDGFGVTTPSNNEMPLEVDSDHLNNWYNILYQSAVNSKAGHKYIASYTVKTSVADSGGFRLRNPFVQDTYALKTSFEKIFLTFTCSEDDSDFTFQCYCSELSTITIKDIFLIDLTQWFGSNDNIPADLLSHPDHFFRYYQGSLAYNEGTLVNANGRYIKTFGMNQWDEEWEEGGINTSTGENESGVNAIRSKNYIRVIPNATYFFKVSVGNPNIYFYDKNKNYIEPLQIDLNSTFTVPSDCCFIRIRTNTSYGTTYNHDISINLYYEDEPRCLTYEPYEELSNVDTGVEVLRSANSVCDTKAPDGTITRKVGVIADLSSLTWYLSSTGLFYSYGLQSVAKLYGETICSMLPSSGSGDRIYIGYDTILYCYFASAGDDVNAFKTAISGVTLNYELAEPTTEQGSSFSENLAIHDFGTMDFSGTSGVPQGNKIFYAVDYKSFIDTTYNYTDGDPSNLALNSELNAKFESYLKSLTGYNASETQVLKNVEGTLTWVTEGE